MPPQLLKDPNFQNFIAGGVAGGAGAILTCPLEVAKTRLQAANNKQFLTSPTGNYRIGTSMFRTISNIAQVEGVLGLWQGLGPALIGVLPSRAIWFTTYQYSKAKLERFNFSSDFQLNMSSALIAGFVVSTATSPIWLIKTRMQLQSKVQDQRLLYRNSWDCVRRVYYEEGVRGFYKGLTASYMGISESSIQMVLYEALRKRQQIINSETLSSPPDRLQDVKLSVLQQITVGSAAKLVAAAGTYPHEVIRTRLREQRTEKQPKYTGVFQGLRVVAQEEGIRGLYGGMAPHLLRVVPNAAILFFVFEFVKDRLNSL